MVNLWLDHVVVLLAQDSGPPGKLDEPTRTVALMAVLGIALLGMLMIASTMLGAHWVRRLGKHRRGPAVPPDVQSKTNLRAKEPRLPQETADPGDTLSTDETLSQ